MFCLPSLLVDFEPIYLANTPSVHLLIFLSLSIFYRCRSLICGFSLVLIVNFLSIDFSKQSLFIFLGLFRTWYIKVMMGWSSSQNGSITWLQWPVDLIINPVSLLEDRSARYCATDIDSLFTCLCNVVTINDLLWLLHS